ncbi:S8 family serine peptidase [Peptoniphilaceae bacterium SGI.131]
MVNSLKKLRKISILICFIIFINALPFNVKAVSSEEISGEVEGKVENFDNYIVIFDDNYEGKNQDFIGRLEKEGIEYEILDEFSALIKGYALKLKKEDAEKIKEWEGIESISPEKIYTDFEIEKKKPSRRKRDLESNKIIEQDKLDSKYDGRGMVVAIIDSGADVEHPDFRLDQGVTGKLTKEKVEGLINSRKLEGQYVSEKIPFVRDYPGYDNDIKEWRKDSHGMHVAGIVGANPSSQSNASRGVIPNCQLVLMKVFGNNGGAGSRSYVKAIEDAVLLEVDSINMSLGFGGGSILLDDPAVAKAIDKAKEKGINVSIAGGNYGHYGWGKSLPDVRYPDYGVIATPGINTSGLTVASIENTKQQLDQFEVENGRNIGHGDINNLEKLPDKESYHNSFKEVVFKGHGGSHEFKNGEDLSGKIVVIARGGDTLAFKDKIANARSHGARFVIIENYAAEGRNIIGMDVADNDVASTMITYSDGQYLRSLTNPKMRISEYSFAVDNPSHGKLSEFSSWGITSDGDLKPDITAPGGAIYSTINDKSYNSQSGTSMAAPHVAGAIAIMNKRVEESFPSVTGKAKHQLVKNLLMNSAVLHKASNNEYSSPRQQGAGVLNLKRAMELPVVMYGETGVGSINLGNIFNDKVNLKFTVENLTSSSISYRAKVRLTTDSVDNGKFTLIPKFLGELDLGNIELSSKEKKVINKEIDIKNLNFPDVPNGKYLDGFIVLSSDSQLELSMPFTGFVGDWTNLKVIEDSIYDLLKDKKLPLYAQDAKPESRGKAHNFGGPAYEFTHLSTLRNGKHFILGTVPGLKPELYYDKNHIAISPNNDGINDHVRLHATFLRTYIDMKVEVFDEKEQTLLYSSLPKMGIKNFFGNDKNNERVTINDAWMWEGKLNKNYTDVADGKYKFVVTVKPVAKNAAVQKVEFPIIVDRVKPEVERAYHVKSKNIFKVEKIKEDLSGVRNVEAFYMNGGSRVDLKVENKNGYVISLPQGKKLSDIKLDIEDWAGNIYENNLEASIKGEKKAELVVEASVEGGGSAPKYAVKIFDKNSLSVKEEDLKIGETYKVKIELSDLNYELVGQNEESITFTEDNSYIILKKVFKKSEDFTAKATIHRDYLDSSNVSYKYDGDIKLKLVNTEDNKEFILTNESGSENIYSVKLKAGNYKLVAYDVNSGWKVRISPETISLGKDTVEGNFDIYYEKEPEFVDPNPEPDPIEPNPAEPEPEEPQVGEIGGWKKEGDKWKYTKKDGQMAISEWLWLPVENSDEKVYKYFDREGNSIDQFYEETKDGETKYYLSQSGPFKGYKKGWWTDPENNLVYYFRPATGSRVEGRQHIDGGWKFFRFNSGSQAFGWQYINRSWSYFDNTSGNQVIGKWAWLKLMDGQYNWKYFDGRGINIDQFRKESAGVWLSQTGPEKSYYKGWWIDSSNGQKYYFRTTSGSRVEGRQYIDGNWYYFRKGSGTQAFGKQYVDGVWRYYHDTLGREVR